MSNHAVNEQDVNRVTNKIRDTFGYVSVAGFAIITAYAILKLTPVWQRNLDEEEQSTRTAAK